jgi:hypothetical protein
VTRHVSVRYFLPIYVTVDLDAERTADDTQYPDDAITRVFMADEEIHLANDPNMTTLIAADVIDEAVESFAGIETPVNAQDRAKAIEIAENTDWPSWMRG